jgi:hypothetical protein
MPKSGRRARDTRALSVRNSGEIVGEKLRLVYLAADGRMVSWWSVRDCANGEGSGNLKSPLRA